MTTLLAMQRLAGVYVPVEVGPMMFSLLRMIIAPHAIGFAFGLAQSHYLRTLVCHH
jgi:hypothetical protein